jgi:simple sugar transport system substrate-binding protein
MRKMIVTAAMIVAVGIFVDAAKADPLNVAFTVHSSASNTFWQAVKKGL